MKPNYDDEATRFENNNQNEETQFANEAAAPASGSQNEEVKAKSNKGATLKNIGIGGATGLVIGGVATFLMGMGPNNHEEDKTADNHKDVLTNPEWVDEKVPVATNVNDDMTFSQAFAAAREEVGPGGCFEWHGTVYGTYTAQEWNNMTPQERAEYNDHFSWNHIDTTPSAHNDAHYAQNTSDDIEVVSVNHTNDTAHHANNTNNTGHHTDPHNTEEVQVIDINDPDIIVEPYEPEIEVLGAVYDPETGANLGGMVIDGEDVVVIDVDNDLTFDYMVADFNHNGVIEEDEIIDIHDQNLTVGDLGGIANPGDLYTASDDNVDYSSDITGEC